MKTILVAAALAAALLTTTTAFAASPAKVSRHTGSIGTYLVDAHGTTLYLFEADTKGKSACTGACAKAWPPLLTTGKPTAGAGVSSAKLGTVKRSNGKLQVTYKGHPLYYFTADAKAGDTKGEGVDGFGAEWYVVSTAGSKIEAAESSTPSSSSTTPSSSYSSDGW